MIRVLVVDDHRLLRAGLLTLLGPADDIEVIGEAPDGARAVDLVREHRPDVVLMDLSMPVLDGVAATARIRAEAPEVRVIALTSFSDQKRVMDALSAGASGYLLKDCEPDEVLAAIRSAAAGHAPVDSRVAAALLPSRTPRPIDRLSQRERDVLRLVAAGLPNKRVALTLGITEGTVKAHLGNIYRHLGVADRTSAAMWAQENLPGA
jgi:DNA-binding NarL/FixJ family response regulator